MEVCIPKQEINCIMSEVRFGVDTSINEENSSDI